MSKMTDTFNKQWEKRAREAYAKDPDNKVLKQMVDDLDLPKGYPGVPSATIEWHGGVSAKKK